MQLKTITELLHLPTFQVKSYLNDALDTVRKEQLKKARKDENTDLADLLHCRKKLILMQGRPADRQRNILAQLAELNDVVYKAMLLKEQFLEIYRANTRKPQCRSWPMDNHSLEIGHFCLHGACRKILP